MTRDQLFAKYRINETHGTWDPQVDNWMSVEVYRLMHDGNLPAAGDASVKWIIDFLDKQDDMDWWIKNVMVRKDWGNLYLTSKRMVYRFAEQLLETK